jgi:hypothetical protein
VVEDAASVVSRIFEEAERRDPQHRRRWIALVDGNNHQISLIEAEARAAEVEVSIVVDFVHALEYLWRAAWSFFDEGDPEAEAWVHEKARAILAGHATYHRLDASRRANADACAKYLTNKAPYLDYASALEQGWPIATGVIEGACRHLVKDRMDITGARWGLEGAEAVLRLRALHTNGDFGDYWRFHIDQERNRVHQSRYDGGVIPDAA